MKKRNQNTFFATTSFSKGDQIQIKGTETKGRFISYVDEKRVNHKKGRRIVVQISHIHDMSMREGDIEKVPIFVGIDMSKKEKDKTVMSIVVPKKVFGWRTEQEDLKLGYEDARPIIIGEALSVQEDKIHGKVIRIGGFGLHAYVSLEALLKSRMPSCYLSLVELSGKMVSERENDNDHSDYRISAETRRCLGLVQWKPVFRQLSARLMLPYAKSLLKKYPEMNLFVELLEARSKGEKEKEEVRSAFLKYLRSRTIEDNKPRGWGWPMSRMGFGHMMCGHAEEMMIKELSKPPHEYSAIVDMLTSRLDKAKEGVIRELLGAKVFEKAKRFAKKVKILEKALRDVSDLKLNELPKFFCRSINSLLGNSEVEISSMINFMYAVTNYDSFDQCTKEILEREDFETAGLKDKRNEFAKGVYVTLDKEFTSIMKLSLETKMIINKI